jgi:ubiquinone/menaquinone biosynthesis C-methylase UbiE
MVGASGKAIGIDLTLEMLQIARSAAEGCRAENMEFLQGSLEKMPFANCYFNLAISNGVLNLAPDKHAAFEELARVLQPGGVLVSADLLLIEDLPTEALKDVDAWST